MKKTFLTYMETAKFLRVSRPTIDRLIAKGEIPSYKIGRRRLFDPEELFEWVKSHRNDGPKKTPVRNPKKKGGK